MNTLDNLRKAAKRWLKELRGSDTRARERFALLRLQNRYGRSVTIDELRSGVRRRLEANRAERSPTPEMDLSRARLLVAQEAGFDRWEDLERTFESSTAPEGTDGVLADAFAPLDMERRMIQPVEMRAALPVRLRDGEMATTSAVWTMLSACLEGDVDGVNALSSADVRSWCCATTTT